MKINRFLSFTKSLALVIAAVGSLACFAHGQEASGKFTLPYAAHFGNATLPAGEYQYNIDVNSSTPITTLRKLAPNAAGFMLMAASTAEANSAEPDRLVIKRIAGQRVVTALYVHELGLVLRYPAPKAQADEVVTQIFKQVGVDARLITTQQGK
jgi:hypothetical protein